MQALLMAATVQKRDAAIHAGDDDGAHASRGGERLIPDALQVAV